MLRILIMIFSLFFIGNCFASAHELNVKKEILSIINSNKNNKMAADDFNSSIYSVVNIRIKSNDELGPLKNRSTVLFGSGVLIAPNLILTNNHVINTRETLDRSLLIINHRSIKDSSKKDRDTKNILLKTDSDNERIFYTSSKHDFTIFEIDPISNDKFRFSAGLLNLSLIDLPIYSLSYPLGHTLIADNKCAGLASEKQIQEYSKKYSYDQRKDMIYHLCDSYPGSSGSPIFDNKGRLLGIHRQSFYQNGVADINVAVSFKTIIDDLTSQAQSTENANLNNGLESAAKSELEWGIKSILLRLPPGHELLTTEAVRNSKIDFLSKSNIRTALINGNISIDYPVYWGVLPDIIGIYNSHYGRDQYRHSMQVNEGQNNNDVLALIYSYLSNEIEQFIYMDEIDREDAAMEVGRILHTIQDSYSHAHTKRDNNGVQEFYYYGKQDKDNHEEKDLVLDKKTGKLKDNALLAVKQSIRLLNAAYASKDQRKEKMLAVINDVFTQSENVVSKTLESTIASDINKSSNLDINKEATISKLRVHKPIATIVELSDQKMGKIESYSSEGGLESGSFQMLSRKPLEHGEFEIGLTLENKKVNEILRPIKCCPPQNEEI